MGWFCGPVDLGEWRLRNLKLTKYKSELGVLIFDYLVSGFTIYIQLGDNYVLLDLLFLFYSSPTNQ